MANWSKDPDEVLDYTRTWARWLDGDTIATSSWTVSDGITQDSDTHTTTTATIWLSGGTLGESYDLTNHITTAGGRTAERTKTIRIRAR